MTTSDSNAPCAHKIIGPAQFLGETGPLCDACGETLPCPHPMDECQRDTFLGGESIVTCKWCGEQLR